MYTYPIHTCTHIQYIHVHISNTYMYTYPIHTCTHIQYIHVHISNTYMYTYPIHTCTHIQYIHVHISNTYMYTYSIVGFANINFIMNALKVCNPRRLHITHKTECTKSQSTSLNQGVAHNIKKLLIHNE